MASDGLDVIEHVPRKWVHVTNHVTNEEVHVTSHVTTSEGVHLTSEGMCESSKENKFQLFPGLGFRCWMVILVPHVKMAAWVRKAAAVKLLQLSLWPLHIVYVY